jgi:mRNA interferase RelE/StbE
MILTPTMRLLKEMKKVPSSVQIQVAAAFQTIIDADSFDDVQHLKKLKGVDNYFRLRIGSYRIGLRWDGEQFFAETIAPRGGFYKKYPPK